jgi:hypothetical protein
VFAALDLPYLKPSQQEIVDDKPFLQKQTAKETG